MKTHKSLHYAVSFDTREIPGRIVAVRVALDRWIMGPKDSVRVDLADHPLYHHLHAYCMANPPEKKS